MAEIWRDIPNFEGHYQVSNYGRVKSLYFRNGQALISNKEKILKPLNNRGYLRVRLCEFKVRNLYSIHRLVAEAFIPNPKNKPCVNHKDGDKTNNCVENLEWCTYSENEQHSHKVLGKQPINKKVVYQYDLNNKIINKFNSLAEAGRSLNKSYNLISNCCNERIKTAYGYIWKFAKESD